MQKSNGVLKSKTSLSRRERLLKALEAVPLRKALMLVLLSIILAVLLTPRITFFHPIYSVGSIAAKNIKADRDFLVKDRAATEQSRQDAARNAEPVFDFDPEVPAAVSSKITSAFMIMSEIYDHISRLKSSNTYFNSQDFIQRGREDAQRALGARFSDREFDFLSRSSFAPEFQDQLIKFVYSAYRAHIVSHEDFLKLERTRAIVIRDVKTQVENEKIDLSSVVDMEERTPYIDRLAASLPIAAPAEHKEIMVSIVIKIVQPNLTFNRSASERRKQIAVERVKPVFFKVQKDEFLVRAGDQVTPIDVDKLESYYSGTGSGDTARSTSVLGTIFIVALMSIIFFTVGKGLDKNFDKSDKDVLFFGALIIVQVLLVRAGIFIGNSVNTAFGFFQTEALFLAIPFAMGSILTAGFYGRSTVFIFAFYSSFLVAFLFESKLLFLAFSLLGGLVAAMHMAYFKQRSFFIRAGIFAGLINILVITGFNISESSLISIAYIIKIVMGFAGGVISGVIVAGLAPLFESIFGYTTDIRLMELANLNQPILQRMIVEAPGTYHHSIIVASLVEAAAEAVQANPLIAKVSAYYHDIGKMTKPLYFIENQQAFRNKHDKLSPKMSSLIIINHVKEGCELARQYNLGKVITDIIRQHHGTSVVSYFYEKAQKDKDPSVRLIPETEFRYPGPRPQTREAGIVLLGDIVEASSRTLSDPTPARIRNLVQNRIKSAFMDGQLDECDLTLSDLNKVAEVFTRTLSGIFHHRIDYPESSREAARSRESNAGPDQKQAEKAKARH
jgi:putative nucleotidyltransferase with HDIG domain